MVTGKFPFEGNNVCSLMKNIGGGVYSIPDWIDESLSDLLRSMLQTDHTKRTTLQQLKHHP
jgi:serine/threonine protein kinase